MKNNVEEDIRVSGFFLLKMKNPDEEFFCWIYAGFICLDVGFWVFEKEREEENVEDEDEIVEDNEDDN